MHNEPMPPAKESLATRAADDRARRLTKRLIGKMSTLADSRAVDALDEAFAGFKTADDRVRRIDAVANVETFDSTVDKRATTTAAGWKQIKHDITADLVGQLNALDNQRERLAKLLRTIAEDSVSF